MVGSRKTGTVNNFSFDSNILFNFAHQWNIEFSNEPCEYRSQKNLLIRSLCGLKYKDICSAAPNITQSRAPILCFIGVDALKRSDRYRQMAEEFTERYKAV